MWGSRAQREEAGCSARMSGCCQWTLKMCVAGLKTHSVHTGNKGQVRLKSRHWQGDGLVELEMFILITVRRR